MGKGDKKTKKGKISMGSHGNSRPRNAAKSAVAVAAAPKKEKVEAAPKAEKKAPAKKAAAKKA
jgi:30S ribosomal protein S31